MNHNDQQLAEANCQTCRYYRHQEKSSGCCHRFPPKFAGDASPKENHHWKFPVVPAHSWCGEYQLMVADLKQAAE